MTEELVEEIDDDYRTSSLPAKFKATIGATDALIRDPNGLDDDARRALLAEFEPPQIVELLLTAALASAFSRAAIAWGPPPGMPTLEVPTPTSDPNSRYGGGD